VVRLNGVLRGSSGCVQLDTQMDLEGQAPSTLSSRACGARSSGDDEKRLQPVRLCVAVSLLDSFDDSSNHIKLPEKNISGAFMGATTASAPLMKSVTAGIFQKMASVDK